jgi:hypothetical protein
VKAISAREDRLLRLVLRFFEQRIFDHGQNRWKR